MTNPWDRNRGKFDVPTSSLPSAKPVHKARSHIIDKPDKLDPRAMLRGVEPMFVVLDGRLDKPAAKPKPEPVRIGKRIRK